MKMRRITMISLSRKIWRITLISELILITEQEGMVQIESFILECKEIIIIIIIISPGPNARRSPMSHLFLTR